MKTANKFLAVLTTAIMLATTPVAFAQLLRPGARPNSGPRIGSRLGANAPAPAPANPAPIVAETAPQPATPGVTRPVQGAAQDAPGAVQTPAPATSAGAATADATRAPVKKSDGSEFIISPQSTPEELVEQAASLLSTEVAFETEQEYTQWVSTMLLTVGKIADRILSLNPDDAHFIEAISLKGQVLCYQASIDPSALPRLKQYAASLARNSRVQSLEDGRNATLAFTGVYLQAVVADIAERQGTARELAAAMNEVNAFVKAHPETSDMCVDLVFPVAVIAEDLDDPKLPAQIWAPIRKTLADAGTVESRNALVMLEGTIRFSELTGNTFEWKGCDADGKPLDQTLVKGRVVLVDFWASWAGQCHENHKQLMELYSRYHSQGFEIVSYNLDPKLEDMEQYLQTHELPWIMLSDRATVDAKQTSLAAYYGIGEIPTMILIGGDGKVASADITMESLVATLQSVFTRTGIPSASSSDASQTTATGTAGQTPQRTTTTGATTGSAPRQTTATGAAGQTPQRTTTRRP
ncbi:MAG: thioredoxin-like domain-containing protein [Thermoguttaceae bacterium]|jgi:thiol-disulfide isomerase/thioredoxin